MAVTLVSTGVRFPDNSIQTTAASGAAGLTLIGSSTATASGATWAASVNVTNWANTYKYLVYTVQGSVAASSSNGYFAFWYNSYRNTNAYEIQSIVGTTVNGLVLSSQINTNLQVVSTSRSVYGLGTIFGTSPGASLDSYPVINGYLNIAGRGSSSFFGSLRRDVAGAGQITSVEIGSVSGTVDIGSITLTIYGVKT